jgi:sugar phosphate permease
MPSYLSETRHITLSKLGFASSVPYLFGFAGLLVIGQIGSRALRSRRAALVAASYLLAAVGLFLAFRAESRNGSIAGLSLAAFFLYGGFGPFWATALDLSPPELRAGFTGFVNVGGQVGGFLAPLAVGRIYDMTRSYSGGFLFMIGALVLSAATLAILQFRPSDSAAAPKKY